MSDPMRPAPTTRTRPSSVTIADYLLFLVAFLLVLSSIASLATLGTVMRVTRAANAGTSAEGSEAVSAASLVGGSVVSILFAIGLVVLALLNNRGRNTARIITWVIGGLVLCCNGLALASGALLSSVSIPSTGDAPNPAELQRRINDELPSWSGPVTTGAAALVIIATLVALILLALPASNEFFRKAPADPTAGAPGYPAYPAYPPMAQTDGPPAPGPPPGSPGAGPPSTSPGGFSPPASPGAVPPPASPGAVPPPEPPQPPGPSSGNPPAS